MSNKTLEVLLQEQISTIDWISLIAEALSGLIENIY